MSRAKRITSEQRRLNRAAAARDLAAAEARRLEAERLYVLGKETFQWDPEALKLPEDAKYHTGKIRVPCKKCDFYGCDGDCSP